MSPLYLPQPVLPLGEHINVEDAPNVLASLEERLRIEREKTSSFLDDISSIESNFKNFNSSIGNSNQILKKEIENFIDGRRIEGCKTRSCPY